MQLCQHNLFNFAQLFSQLYQLVKLGTFINLLTLIESTLDLSCFEETRRISCLSVLL